MGKQTHREVVKEAIDFAYEIGDKDECFNKHIAHTISAIVVRNGYKNVTDYPDSGFYYKMKENGKEEEAFYLLNKLHWKWKKVEELHEKIGNKKLLKLVLDIQNDYPLLYIDDYLKEDDSYSYIKFAEHLNLARKNLNTIIQHCCSEIFGEKYLNSAHKSKKDKEENDKNYFEIEKDYKDGTWKNEIYYSYLFSEIRILDSELGKVKKSY